MVASLVVVVLTLALVVVLTLTLEVVLLVVSAVPKAARIRAVQKRQDWEDIVALLFRL